MSAWGDPCSHGIATPTHCAPCEAVRRAWVAFTPAEPLTMRRAFEAGYLAALAQAGGEA